MAEGPARTSNLSDAPVRIAWISSRAWCTTRACRMEKHANRPTLVGYRCVVRRGSAWRPCGAVGRVCRAGRWGAFAVRGGGARLPCGAVAAVLCCVTCTSRHGSSSSRHAGGSSGRTAQMRRLSVSVLPPAMLARRGAETLRLEATAAARGARAALRAARPAAWCGTRICTPTMREALRHARTHVQHAAGGVVGAGGACGTSNVELVRGSCAWTEATRSRTRHTAHATPRGTLAMLGRAGLQWVRRRRR